MVARSYKCSEKEQWAWNDKNESDLHIQQQYNKHKLCIL